MSTTPQNPKITLSPERHAQLIDVREAIGARSISDAIGQLIRAFADQGKIEHAVPGVTINRAKDGLAIRFDDRFAGGLTFEGARALADAIRTYIADDKTRKASVVDLRHDFIVTGYGRAVVIKLVERGVEKRFSPDIAEDVAQLLERAAAHPAS